MTPQSNQFMCAMCRCEMNPFLYDNYIFTFPWESSVSCNVSNIIKLAQDITWGRFRNSIIIDLILYVKLSTN